MRRGSRRRAAPRNAPEPRSYTSAFARDSSGLRHPRWVTTGAEAMTTRHPRLAQAEEHVVLLAVGGGSRTEPLVETPDGQQGLAAHGERCAVGEGPGGERSLTLRRRERLLPAGDVGEPVHGAERDPHLRIVEGVSEAADPPGRDPAVVIREEDHRRGRAGDGGVELAALAWSRHLHDGSRSAQTGEHLRSAAVPRLRHEQLVVGRKRRHDGVQALGQELGPVIGGHHHRDLRGAGSSGRRQELAGQGIGDRPPLEALLDDRSSSGG